MIWMVAAAWASGPMVDVTWKGEQSVLQVRPGAGMKISPDAPVDIRLSVDGRARTYGVDGAMVVSGLPIGGVRGAALEGEVSLQVCEDDTGICRPEQVSISGSVPGSKKGTVALNAVVHQEQKHTSPFNSDAAPVAEAAFARAKARGEQVLLDFSAVWCPPCNLLAAEVLHAADAADHLAGLHVAVVDVDHPSSWELKSRYAVGSYPTVVVVDAEGNELDRMVGYPGRDAFLAFVAGADEPAPDWAAVDPTTLTPDVAATGLIRALDAHRPAQAWVEASADSDSREAHVGRFRHTPSAAELEWLMQHDVDRALDWLPHVGDWGEGEGRPLLEAAFPAILASVGPVEAADVMWYAAQLHDESQAKTDYAAGAALLRSAFTGDFATDRAHYEFLATLLDKAGRFEDALHLLDQTAREHPDEPTFLLAGAYLLNEHEQYDATLVRTTAALSTAWGDNRLRVVHAHCTALVGLERGEEAAELAAKTLEESVAPETSVKVRTHRYREKLEAFLATPG